MQKKCKTKKESDVETNRNTAGQHNSIYFHRLEKINHETTRNELEKPTAINDENSKNSTRKLN